MRKDSGLVTSGILHLSAVCFVVCGAPQFYQNVRQGHDVSSLLYFYDYFVEVEINRKSSPHLSFGSSAARMNGLNMAFSLALEKLDRSPRVFVTSSIYLSLGWLNTAIIVMTEVYQNYARVERIPSE